MQGAAGAGDIHAALMRVMDADHGRLLAALIGQLRDFQLAEDALQDALASALTHWARGGVPLQPAGWLLKVARRKAIDRLRRSATARDKAADVEYLQSLDRDDAERAAEAEIPDERLRLIFTCCHPALDQKTRVALTLRTLGGLTTAEIARAFLDSESAMAQRLVRARHKISRAGVPYAVPGPEVWPARLPPVLTVIYLIFNEGYAASGGDVQIRHDLCAEAIYLARVIDRLRPGEAEVEGLLALMLLIDARRDARTGPGGALVTLEEQDRSLWHRATLAEGLELVDRALQRRRFGPFQVKAAIQGIHAAAPDWTETDWPEILGLYDTLLRFEDTSVVRLNRAAALSYVQGPVAARRALEPLRADLSAYAPFHATEADLLRRADDPRGALAAYDRAVALTGNAAERRFLQDRADRTKKEAEQKLGL